MDFENLINAFIPYGLPSLVIGLAVGIVFAIVDRLIYNHDSTISTYLPIAVAMVIFIVYSAFVSPNEIFSEQTISAGLLSGSLAAAVFAFIKNLKSGNSDISALKSLLYCYFDQKKAKILCKKINELIKNKNKNFSEELLKLLEKENLTDFAINELIKKICNNFMQNEVNNKDKK